MRVLAIDQLLAVVWICVIYYLLGEVFPFDVVLSHIKPWQIYFLVLAELGFGALFGLAGFVAKGQTSASKRVPQIVLTVFVLAAAVFMVFVGYWSKYVVADFCKTCSGPLLHFIVVFFQILSVAILVLGYMGVRYIERARRDIKVAGVGNGTQNAIKKHHEFIIFGDPLVAFQCSLMVAVIPGLFVMRFLGFGYAFILLIPGVLGVICLLIYYNYVPSSFQKDRKVVGDWACGGNIFFLGGAMPFFRLLLYGDGLEVRTMFQRYFIPYGKIEKFFYKPNSMPFRFWIISDIPGVPQDIRLYSTQMKSIRDEFLKLYGSASV